MDAILQRARNGETTNSISGERGPKHRGKGIISRVRLIAASLADTPEARELKALLKQNGDAALGQGSLRYRWSPESLALLAAEYEKGMPTTKITSLINERFNDD